MMPNFAAIALEGAKGVGKTALGTQRAATVLDLSRINQRSLVAADEDYVTRVPSPVLIDEWQMVPPVWDAVKRAVDEDWSGGRFLLAGSAHVLPGTRIHSGAGRIISLRMRPMSISERGIGQPFVSLRALLAGTRERLDGESGVVLEQYIEEILASGFPGIRRLPTQAQGDQLDSYITRIVDYELPQNGVEIRRPGALRSWMAAYAAATAGVAAYSTVLDAATPGEGNKPSRVSTDTYREHLTRLFILEPLPAWIPAFNPLKRLGSSPKHHLVDPALAARLVGVGRDGLLRGDGTRVGLGEGTWTGALFESLVVQSIRVYADTARATVSHMRTQLNDGVGREIDIVVESREDNRILAIEVKLSSSVEDKDVRHLNWLHQQVGERLADKIVINTGPYAYRRRDGVGVVPLALLGP